MPHLLLDKVRTFTLQRLEKKTLKHRPGPKNRAHTILISLRPSFFVIHLPTFSHFSTSTTRLTQQQVAAPTASVKMKLNISYPANGSQKLVEIEDERKLRDFMEKRVRFFVLVQKISPREFRTVTRGVEPVNEGTHRQRQYLPCRLSTCTPVNRSIIQSISRSRSNSAI